MSSKCFTLNPSNQFSTTRQLRGLFLCIIPTITHLTAIKIIVFWDDTVRSTVERPHIKVPYRQGKQLWNTDTYPPNHTSHPRRLSPQHAQLWESQISNQHHIQSVMLPFVHNTIQHNTTLTVFHLQNTLPQNAKCTYKDLPATELISMWFPPKSILPFWPQRHEFLNHYKQKKLKKNNI